MREKTKIGIFGIGLDTYWDQFEGLKDRLIGYQDQVVERIEQMGVEVVNAGLVDNPTKAAAASELFTTQRVELIFIYMSTYALSSTVLPVIQNTNAYIVILNLQPVSAIDYKYINSMSDRGKMTGEWLAHCQACSAPEIASVFNRSNIKYDIVTGYLQDHLAWKQIEAWVGAAKVSSSMKSSRMAIIGHYYCGMLDVYTDLLKQSATFGTHIELVEMCKIKEYRDKVTEEQQKVKIAEFNSHFDVVPECEQYEIDRAARTSVAFDDMVKDLNIDSIAYYYEGTNGNDYQNIVTSVIAGHTLLTAKSIPVAGECEIKNVQAMKILSILGGGGSFSEFYAIDFDDDIVMLGHDGPAHPLIAEGRVKLVPLPIYHGKPGKGLSIQMSVRHGDVTILSVCENREGVFLLVAEGKSVPEEILEIGNTNSRYRFPISAREFMDKWSKAGPSHHCAIGVGHLADTIEKYAKLIGIPIIRVC